jgi:hypothetical protein
MISYPSSCPLVQGGNKTVSVRTFEATRHDLVLWCVCKGDLPISLSILNPDGADRWGLRDSKRLLGDTNLSPAGASRPRDPLQANTLIRFHDSKQRNYIFSERRTTFTFPRVEHLDFGGVLLEQHMRAKWNEPSAWHSGSTHFSWKPGTSVT